MAFENVLVAVDGSSSSFQAAVFSSHLVKGDGGIHLLCVVDRLNPPTAPTYAAEGGPRERCELALASARAAIPGPRRVGSRAVIQGPARVAILQRAEEVGADLVCVGSGRGRLKLGSVSSHVVRHAAISVALLREGNPALPKIERIVAGVNPSPSSLAAGRRAIELAIHTGASLFFATILPSGRGIPREGVELEDAPPGLRDLEEYAGLEEVARLARDLGVRVASAQFVPGAPAEALLRLADAWRGELLVVGAGRAGVHPGSVAERLAGQSRIPLLVVRGVPPMRR